MDVDELKTVPVNHEKLSSISSIVEKKKILENQRMINKFRKLTVLRVRFQV